MAPRLDLLADRKERLRKRGLLSYFILGGPALYAIIAGLIDSEPVFIWIGLVFAGLAVGLSEMTYGRARDLEIIVTAFDTDEERGSMGTAALPSQG